MYDISFRHILSDLLSGDRVSAFRREMAGNAMIFDNILGYEGIKRTFVRSLNSKEPVHILLVGPPGQAKTLFLKCILDTFGEKKAFFTVGSTASKSGLIDVLFDMQPKYLLVDEIEHLKPEYQTAAAIGNGNWHSNSNHAFQSQTYASKNVGICYK